MVQTQPGVYFYTIVNKCWPIEFHGGCFVWWVTFWGLYALRGHQSERHIFVSIYLLTVSGWIIQIARLIVWDWRDLGDTPLLHECEYHVVEVTLLSHLTHILTASGLNTTSVDLWSRSYNKADVINNKNMWIVFSTDWTKTQDTGIECANICK